MDRSTTHAPRSPWARVGWLLPLLLASLLAGDAATGHIPASSLLHAQQAMPSMLLLLCGGALSGLLAGLLGIGGALVTIPVLYLALPGLGIDTAAVPATAVATALVAMVPMTLMAAWQQWRHGAIETGWLRRMAAPTALGAACGALFAAALNGPVLALLFALQSCWYGVRLLTGRRPGTASSSEHVDTKGRVSLSTWLVAPPMAAFCACVGMGGGSIITPFLLRRRIPFRQAVATAGALNLCIALGGTLAFAALGAGAASAAACLPAAALLAAGALASVSCGVSLSHRAPAALLQRLVGSVNVLSAVALVCQVAQR